MAEIIDDGVLSDEERLELEKKKEEQKALLNNAGATVAKEEIPDAQPVVEKKEEQPIVEGLQEQPVPESFSKDSLSALEAAGKEAKEAPEDSSPKEEPQIPPRESRLSEGGNVVDGRTESQTKADDNHKKFVSEEGKSFYERLKADEKVKVSEDYESFKKLWLEDDEKLEKAIAIAHRNVSFSSELQKKRVFASIKRSVRQDCC